jgi:HNH endonuclease
MSYEIFIGPIPAGRQVQHKCDRKDCINPRHLKLGTHKTNNADMFSRGEPELTPQEFERLCVEEAEVERRLKLRRDQLRAQLRRSINENRDAHRSVIREHRTAMRLQRRALAEEREQERKEQRTERLAKINPEAMAKLKASIAELKESTPEELKTDRVAEIAKRKASDPRRWRRNGSGDSHA